MSGTCWGEQTRRREWHRRARLARPPAGQRGHPLATTAQRSSRQRSDPKWGNRGPEKMAAFCPGAVRPGCTPPDPIPPTSGLSAVRCDCFQHTHPQSPNPPSPEVNPWHRGSQQGPRDPRPHTQDPPTLGGRARQTSRDSATNTELPPTLGHYASANGSHSHPSMCARLCLCRPCARKRSAEPGAASAPPRPHLNK